MRHTGGSQSILLLKTPRSFIWHSTVTSVKLLRPFAPNFATLLFTITLMRNQNYEKLSLMKNHLENIQNRVRWTEHYVKEDPKFLQFFKKIFDLLLVSLLYFYDYKNALSVKSHSLFDWGRRQGSNIVRARRNKEFIIGQSKQYQELMTPLVSVLLFRNYMKYK